MLRQNLNQTTKTKLNTTLRSWLDLLICTSDELKENLEKITKDNPFVSIENKFTPPKRNFFKEISKNSVSDTLEAVVVQKDSLWQTLTNQINPPLFPTKKSQDIAYKIIECINDEGYFEYDDKILKEFKPHEVELIRKRFMHLEPSGIGAKDFKESFIFQLYELDLEDEIYKFCLNLIENLDEISKFTKNKNYEKALEILRKFKNPPAVEYMQNSEQIASDIKVSVDENGLSVSVNDEIYPEVVLDVEGLDEKDAFLKDKVRQAKDLIDALNMRKNTLYKIGLMIIEYQYEYFLGGDIKPMKLKNIADDLDRNPSTISRAISNKYLESWRGTVALKNFFTTAVDNDISNAAIKSFLINLVKNENKQKPLSDIKILELIQKEFDIKMVRRTITKYRQMLNIESSSQRKKIYNIKG